MNYDGFYVYRKYLAIKLHFDKDEYNYHDYDGHVHTKLETFTKRNDRYFYHKLSVKYNQDEIEDFLVANFVKNKKIWSGNLLEKEAHEIYLQHKKRKESSTYWFKEDCGRIRNALDMDNSEPTNALIVNNGQHPTLLRFCIGNKIGPETVLIMDFHLNFMKDWDKNISENVIWPGVRKKLNKFKPFVRFNETETKLILKEVFL
tara:strand:+ start:1164 stop:1772 length:609 start_codon:yes stop_codon:yes gene_type:complete